MKRILRLKLLWNTRRASGPVEREQGLLLYVFGGWAAAMLLGALGDRDYAYYTLLRWVVCIAAVLVAILGLRWRHGWAVGVFAFVGILFNPIVPIELSPGMWHLIDIGVAALFLMAVALVAPPGDAVARRLARLLTHGHVDTLPARAVMVVIALLIIALGAVAFTTGVYRLDVARWEWRKDFQAYKDIPSNYRKYNPEVEAKLFITGQLESLETFRARSIAVQLMQENKIDIKDVKGLQPKKYEKPTDERMELRQYFEKFLGGPAAPATGSNLDKWNLVSTAVGAETLRALRDFWFFDRPLSAEHDQRMRALFSAFPLGQTNYNTWLKQTLRQLQMRASTEAAVEKEAVGAR